MGAGGVHVGGCVWVCEWVVGVSRGWVCVGRGEGG